MKIVMLDGALANQITQYIFSRCLEIATKDVVYLDDSWFYLRHDTLAEQWQGIENHQYQMFKFPNAKPNLVSNYFEPEVWEEILGIARQRAPLRGGSHLPQILLESGMNLAMVAEVPSFNGLYSGSVVSIPYYYYMPKLLNCQGSLYFWGYFTNAGWFKSHRETFMHELWLPEPQQDTDKEMVRQIETTYSVGVHVRLGSYAETGISHPPEYYKNALQEVLREHDSKKPHFFIFSDEIEYCKEHAREYGFDTLSRVTYCASNRTEQDNQVDMQLMSRCKGLILCRSVYGFMAHLLSQQSDQWAIESHGTRRTTIP